jgi:crotonobetainyl-CoA:carnitine CoA-transferase CaiB-like acyl-CoA transferase
MMMPFAGLTVIEACSNLSGPVAGTIFGDLGAELLWSMWKRVAVASDP